MCFRKIYKSVAWLFSDKALEELNESERKEIEENKNVCK